jgi:sec-independent protein translocase protein TatA
MFKSFGMGELLVILIIVLLIFGAGKLPQIFKSLGEGMKEFKKAVNTKEDEVKDEKKG